MKKIIFSVILTAGAGILHSQITKPVAKPVNMLKTKADSVCYVIGEVAAFALIEKGMGDVKITNNTVFIKAINDILNKKLPLFDDVTANLVLNNYMTNVQSEKAKPAIMEGQKYLAQNKLKPGIKTTASGLQYEIIKEGTGIKPTAVDTFVCHYRGTLINGS